MKQEDGGSVLRACFTVEDLDSIDLYGLVERLCSGGGHGLTSLFPWAVDSILLSESSSG